MIVGFSGTRHGLTVAQIAALARVLVDLAPSRVAHGVCVGGDEVAHRIARALGVPVDHHHGVGAGGDRTWRAAVDVLRGDVVHPEAPHLARNATIAAACDVLVAAPREEHGESARSGTWWAVRSARRLGRPVVIVRPSGSVERER